MSDKQPDFIVNMKTGEITSSWYTLPCIMCGADTLITEKPISYKILCIKCREKQ